MLVHRLRRWPNINPALFQRLVFAGYTVSQRRQTFAGRRDCVMDLDPNPDHPLNVMDCSLARDTSFMQIRLLLFN